MISKPENGARSMLSKVPEVTIFFWIIKVLCTTVGETASDFLNVNLGFGLTGTSVVMGIILLVALFFQFRANKYIPGVYWLTVVLISIVGTLVTDNMTDAMGIPLEFSTVAFSILLVLTFTAWYISEKTLSIHSIFTKRREAFYWLTILFTFALGTAAGDLMAESLGLGYLVTGIIVCTVVVIVTIARKLKLDTDLAFWLVYIMTRPLGASIGDYLSQPNKYGGLGLGATITSVIFVSAIILTVAFLSITRKDQISKPSAKAVDEPMRKGFLTQAVAVICVLALAGGAGYYMRHTSLQNEIDNSMSQTDQNQDSSSASAQTTSSDTLKTSDPQASVSGTSSPSQPASGANSPSAAPQATSQAVSTGKGAQTSKLGDLSGFLTIEQDMLSMVNSGNLGAAKTRADDLEYTWDNAEARLKPKDPKKWSVIDKTVDTVLRQARAVHQDTNGCKTALEAAIAALES